MLDYIYGWWVGGWWWVLNSTTHTCTTFSSSKCTWWDGMTETFVKNVLTTKLFFFFAQKSKNVFPIQLIIGFTSCLLFSKTKKCCQFILTNWIGFYTKIATLIYWRYIPKQLSCSSLHFFFSPYSWNMIWFWSLFYCISNRKYLLLLLL